MWILLVFFLAICQAQRFDLKIDPPIALDITRNEIHLVIVDGDSAISFSPSHLSANVGDHVFFSFTNPNYTIIQSSLQKPCAIHEGPGSLLHQLVPNNAGPLSFRTMIQTLEPLWFFVKTDAGILNCHAGMTFAVNPGKELPAFRNNAHIRRKLIPPTSLSTSLVINSSREASISTNVPTSSSLVSKSSPHCATLSSSIDSAVTPRVPIRGPSSIPVQVTTITQVYPNARPSGLPTSMGQDVPLSTQTSKAALLVDRRRLELTPVLFAFSAVIAGYLI